MRKDIFRRIAAVLMTALSVSAVTVSAAGGRIINSTGAITLNNPDGTLSTIDSDDIEANAQALSVLNGQLGDLHFKYDGGYYWASPDGEDNTWSKIGAVGNATPEMVLKTYNSDAITFSSQSGVDIAGAMENYSGQSKETNTVSQEVGSSTTYFALTVPSTGYYTTTSKITYPLASLGNAAAENVLYGKTFTSAAGIAASGQMANKSGATVAGVKDALNGNTLTLKLPATGYYDSTSKVTYDLSNIAVTSNLTATGSNESGYLKVTLPANGYYLKSNKLAVNYSNKAIKVNPTGSVNTIESPTEDHSIAEEIGTSNINLLTSNLNLGAKESLTIPSGYYSSDITVKNGVKDKGSDKRYIYLGTARSIDVKSYDGWEKFTKDNFIVGIQSVGSQNGGYGNARIDQGVTYYSNISGASVSYSYNATTGILSISASNVTSTFAMTDYSLSTTRTGAVTTCAYLVP